VLTPAPQGGPSGRNLGTLKTANLPGDRLAVRFAIGWPFALRTTETSVTAQN
jgi:hypothetical protein